jgi:hypothetical protein
MGEWGHCAPRSHEEERDMRFLHICTLVCALGVGTSATAFAQTSDSTTHSDMMMHHHAMMHSHHTMMMHHSKMMTHHRNMMMHHSKTMSHSSGSM